ncbi:MAG: hypothetical protein ACK2UN_18595 [Candidatus Promineifilaceae bacterium]|jgi:hypothetical protein
MQPESANSENSKIGRFLRVFAPFFILLVLLALLNYRIGSVEPARQPVAVTTTEVTKATSATAPRATPETGQRQAAIATAIPNATISIPLTVEPTQTPVATWAPEEVARLTGPPPSSRFSTDVPLSFYWQAGRSLPEQYLYRLYITDNETTELVAELSEPNLGSAFAVNLLAEEVDLESGDYFWQVRLVQQPGEIDMGASEKRPFQLTGAAN